MSEPYSALVREWERATAHHASEILSDPLTYALAHLTSRLIIEATAEISRLKSQLDGYAGRQVLHCARGQWDAILPTLGDAAPGTVLRATDTGEELELDRLGHWLPREPAA
jgi:hypothetical protein